ncbi:excalibur calcium-binding domain-containing protein [Corynebacterium testudinoris]|uniref:Putative calcium-binding protein n=1 Tax=Corynebacterium testudinoris TaxID=136857 RepID=A0A0G3H6M6_9CORY|nr:putative calcium-binding protein [Corynebacterium testudinoris]MBX8994617.1 excalibur calcium-binding domain-containing protein [Corynebacterium testudinoris]
MRRLLILPLALSATLVLAACGGGEATPVTETVTSVKVSTQKVTVTESVVEEPEPEAAPEPEPEPVVAPVEAQVNTVPQGFASIPEPARAVAPAPAPAPAAAYYKNCSAARAAGAAPVYAGSPGYGTHLDRDGDGVGCE